MGWFSSFSAKQAIDRQGQPIPWITYPCLYFLAERIHSNLTVFEYGSGNSTLWWASRVSRVVTCEHDKAWYERMINRLPSNASLSHIEVTAGGDYSREILKYREEFDIVVIDGRDRVNCAKNALPALKKGGIIVWDNSERLSYQEGFDYLASNGFRRIDFSGIGPVNVYSWSTSIFYRDQNCLGV